MVWISQFRPERLGQIIPFVLARQSVHQKSRLRIPVLSASKTAPTPAARRLRGPGFDPRTPSRQRSCRPEARTHGRSRCGLRCQNAHSRLARRLALEVAARQAGVSSVLSRPGGGPRSRWAKGLAHGYPPDEDRARGRPYRLVGGRRSAFRWPISSRHRAQRGGLAWSMRALKRSCMVIRQRSVGRETELRRRFE